MKIKFVRALAVLFSATLVHLTPALADPSVAILPFSFTAPGDSVPISLANQNSCTVTFTSVGTGGSVTIEGASDSPPSGTKHYTPVTGIGVAGVISAPATATPVGGSIAPQALTYGLVRATALASGTLSGYMVCTGATTPSVGGSGSSNVTIVGPLTSGAVAVHNDGSFTGGSGAPLTGNSTAVAPAANQGVAIHASNGTTIDALKSTGQALWVAQQGTATVTQAAGSATQVLDSGGTNKLSVSAGGAAKVDGSAVTQPISGAVTATLGAGSALAGKVGIDQTTPGTTNGVVVNSGTITANAGTGTFTVNPAAGAAMQILDSGGTNKLAVSAGGAAKVDGSAVTQPVSGTVSISGTVPVSGTFFPATQPVSCATSATCPTNSSQVGTWTVQPGNTANTTPWLASLSQGGNTATVTASNALKVDGSAVTQPVSGTVTASQAFNMNGGPQTAGTANGVGMVGVYNTTAPAPTNGQAVPIQLNSAGSQIVANSDQFSLSNNLVMTSTSNAVTMTVNQSTPTIRDSLQISGSTGTHILEGQIGDGQWQALPVRVTNAANIGQVIAAGTFTAAGIYTVDASGFSQVRDRVSVAGTGTAIVSMSASPATSQYPGSTAANSGILASTVSVTGLVLVTANTQSNGNALTTNGSAGIVVGSYNYGHISGNAARMFPNCDTTVPVNISTATTTAIAAVSGTTSVWVCSYDLYVVSGTLPSFQFEYGAGTACATSPTVLSGTFGGIAGAVGERFNQASGGSALLKAPASQGLCIVTGGTTPNLQGSVTYAQYIDQ